MHVYADERVSKGCKAVEVCLRMGWTPVPDCNERINLKGANHVQSSLC